MITALNLVHLYLNYIIYSIDYLNIGVCIYNFKFAFININDAALGYLRIITPTEKKHLHFLMKMVRAAIFGHVPTAHIAVF